MLRVTFNQISTNLEVFAVRLLDCAGDRYALIDYDKFFNEVL